MNKILKSKRIATSLILSLILSLTGVTNVFAFSNVENNTNVLAETRDANLTIPCNDGGRISHQALDYTITVSESATYTFTMASTTQSGSLLVIFESAGGTRYINNDINGSYQNRFDLPAGTYRLRLSNGSGVSTFSWSIHKTF